MTIINTNVVWHPLSNCPSFQLERVSDNNYSLVCAETTVIKSKSEYTNFKWVDVGLYKEVADELAIEELQGVIQTQQGIKLVNKHIVSYDPDFFGDIIKAFNRSGFITSNKVNETTLSVDSSVDKSFLSNLPGVLKIESESIVQRKEYIPTFIPTGILIPNLPWHLLTQPNPNKPYTLASNTLGGLGKLMIPVHSVTSADYTIVREGEMVALLSLITNGKEVNLIREDLNVANA